MPLSTPGRGSPPDRTWLASERTLMAWVRTATSLISFGFTIYKFFEFEAGRGLRPNRLLSPRAFGMIMIGTGLVAHLLGVIDQRQSSKILHKEFSVAHRSTAVVVAAIVCVMGLLALGSALLRGGRVNLTNCMRIVVLSTMLLRANATLTAQTPLPPSPANAGRRHPRRLPRSSHRSLRRRSRSRRSGSRSTARRSVRNGAGCLCSTA